MIPQEELDTIKAKDNQTAWENSVEFARKIKELRIKYADDAEALNAIWAQEVVLGHQRDLYCYREERMSQF